MHSHENVVVAYITTIYSTKGVTFTPLFSALHSGDIHIRE